MAHDASPFGQHHHAGDDDHGPAPRGAGAPPPRPVDPAQEALVGALRASFNVLRVLMIVLVVLYGVSGIFRVDSGWQGLVARFGALREAPAGGQVYPPGWYLALPDPLDKKYVLTGQVLTHPVTTFMFAHPEAAISKNLADIVPVKQELQPGVDGAMITGDRNLSHGRWEIQYRIDNAASFVRQIGSDPNAFAPVLTRLAESAVVREVAGRTVEEVTREQLESVRGGVQQRLQQALTELGTGVTIVQVLAYTIEPGAVRDAFIDVSRAENERRALEDQARERATEVLSRAAGGAWPRLLAAIREYGALQEDPNVGAAALAEALSRVDALLLEAEQQESGQVSIRLREAREQANTTSAQLRQQFEQFERYLEQRRDGRELITMLGLWNEMRAEILGNRANEIFFVPASNVIEILVNRDPQRKIELEQQEIMQRQLQPRP